MNKASFQFVHPEELPRLVELEQLDHVTVCQNLPVSARRSGHKTGCESWKCAWAPDRSYLAWSAGHSLVHLLPWDVEKQKKHNPNHMDGLQGRNYHVIDTGELVHSVAFGITSNTVKKQRWMYQNLTSTVVLATGHKSGRIKLWNCETGSLLLELIDHKDVVRDMHFATDDSLRLVSASLDGYIKLWEFDEKGDCNLYRSLKSNTKHVFGCRWSPNMKFIAAVGSTKVVLLFSVEGRDCPNRWRLEGHHHDVVACDFSRDGALLATASCDTRVIVWDIHTRTMLLELGHLHPSPRPIYAGGANDHYVRGVAFAPDGLRIASVSDDGYVRLWHLRNTSDPQAVSEIEGGLCCAFSADGQQLAVGNSSGSLTVLASPSEPESLMHLCRITLRRSLPTQSVVHLPLPNILCRYLTYELSD